MATYPSDTAGVLLDTHVPTVFADDTAKIVMAKLSREEWESIGVTYVLNGEKELVGIIPIKKLVTASGGVLCGEIMTRNPIMVSVMDDQERVAYEAIANDLKSVPVKDKDGKFLGVIPADKIIDILHEEHLEDFLRSSGIAGHGARILDFLHVNLWEIIKARLPWLIAGLLIGLVGSFVVSRFEETLKEHTALAFFISMVAYMSDSIGTQSETIFIRSQAILKFNVYRYVAREFIVGVIIGSIAGVLAGMFAYIISGNIEIGLILGISLVLSMSFATVLACITPIVLKGLGKDPAVGSGPFTTAIQDMVSLLIYFSVAMALLGTIQ